MGRGMCKNLVEKGNLSHPLLIYNRTTQRANDLAARIGNSTVKTSVAELVSSADIIFYCLGDDKAVLDMLDQITSSDISGKTLVDCSTIHPDTTAQEEETIRSRGGQFVACPVFGAPAMADAGQLICIIAGPQKAVESVKPFCQGVMGRAVLDYSGQATSKASLMKVIGNTFISSMVETLSEGHVVAEKTGLGVEQLHQFIELMFPGPYTAYSNRLMSGDYYKRDEPLFAVDLARKDARHAQALANRAGVTMKNIQLSDDLLQGVQDHMGSRGDIAGMYGAKRVESGLPFEN